MEQRHSKPRVFLSHSKKDSAFIEKLRIDLQRCQIDPWLDTYEIRQGVSWQESIFEYGIPTCDAVIVYFTENSLSSTVVKKEMDVGLLQKLKDNNVAFLPYVDKANIRELLRPDIQALHTLEWNNDNYSSVLPIVVSEVWRSYLERIVLSATKDERLKRVEAERELEKYKSQSGGVFSKSENEEFEYIWNSLNKKIPFSLGLWNDEDSEIFFFLHLSTVVALLVDFMAQEYNQSLLYRDVIGKALKLAKVDETIYDYYRIHRIPNIKEELLLYGLIERVAYSRYLDDTPGVEHKLELSKKYFRFRYWLAYQKKLPDQILVEIDNGGRIG